MFCSSTVWEQWSSVIGLQSVESDRTGQQSSVNRLQALPVQCYVVKTLTVHCHCEVCSVTGGHSAGCRLYWACLQTSCQHLMVLKYVEASFHLQSVRINNINTLKKPKLNKQCGIKTIPAAVISKMLLPLPKIMADNVHNHINLFCDVSPGLPTYINQISHNIKFNLQLTPQSPPQTVQLQHTQIIISHNIQFHLLLTSSLPSPNCPTPNIHKSKYHRI